MQRVRWGILSTAKIGTQKVIPGLQRSELCEVLAIASRNRDTAAESATDLAIPRAYGSYEALLTDPDIDAVYIPLPNHLHVPWSIRAIEAGKHVLCEKPIGLSSVEGEQLLAAAAEHPHLKVMEAFMYRHHPQWQKAKQLVDDGEIGVLRAIQATFSYFNVDPANIRNDADIGGGGLMDIGCYCISLARFLFVGEPQKVCGILEHDPNFKTDCLASAILDFGTGLASFVCSTQLVPYQRVNVLGTEARVEIEIPFNAPPDRPCRIWHEKNGETVEIEFPICDQYTIQGDLFASSILNDSPVPTPLADAVANMRVIEAIKTSASSRRWV
ncbi:Gfo/Idh/MocA family protein [Bythopirellula polymerisocia]|uniref:Glucose--fructose oxidoreductase n=1 Tax=Bythopirellula polymerisocia TaxID=2528003 RepID=A0A5C6C6W5_9BACT|nr:Gfo/Idh/MocA family oxidoreductase [Bythopirellula polymerisocia]TWU20373.1 Glucose--fructose oxidoreductase precursor [Bythopirellula polymerisocia]